MNHLTRQYLIAAAAAVSLAIAAVDLRAATTPVLLSQTRSVSSSSTGHVTLPGGPEVTDSHQQSASDFSPFTAMVSSSVSFPPSLSHDYGTASLTSIVEPTHLSATGQLTQDVEAVSGAIADGSSSSTYIVTFQTTDASTPASIAASIDQDQGITPLTSIRLTNSLNTALFTLSAVGFQLNQHFSLSQSLSLPPDTYTLSATERLEGIDVAPVGPAGKGTTAYNVDMVLAPEPASALLLALPAGALLGKRKRARS